MYKIKKSSAKNSESDICMIWNLSLYDCQKFKSQPMTKIDYEIYAIYYNMYNKLYAQEIFDFIENNEPSLRYLILLCSFLD